MPYIIPKLDPRDFSKTISHLRKSIYSITDIITDIKSEDPIVFNSLSRYLVGETKYIKYRQVTAGAIVYQVLKDQVATINEREGTDYLLPPAVQDVFDSLNKFNFADIRGFFDRVMEIKNMDTNVYEILQNFARDGHTNQEKSAILANGGFVYLLLTDSLEYILSEEIPDQPADPRLDVFKEFIDQLKED